MFLYRPRPTNPVPKLVFIGVAANHTVPNKRTCVNAGALVAVVRYNGASYVMDAPSGKVSDLKFANPGAFGRHWGRPYFAGRWLRQLPTSEYVARNSAMPQFHVRAKGVNDRLVEQVRATQRRAIVVSTSTVAAIFCMSPVRRYLRSYVRSARKCVGA